MTAGSAPRHRQSHHGDPRSHKGHAQSDRWDGRAADFVLNLRWSDVPEKVRRQVKLALLDVLGATLAGSRTPAGKIVAELAAVHWRGDEASILLFGRTASPVGAALANGVLANALDIDDGYRPIKGHPGAVVFPAALAAAEAASVGGEEFLTALLVGYEVAIRAGLAWHATYREYHGSGAWGAVGAAAAAGRLLNLNRRQLMHALGIAEYHAPVTPIMRCVEAPAMVKDGIGWGAMAGISAALLAERGFTGIPSVLEASGNPSPVADLGQEYRIMQLYFKPHACCRWAQPPIEALRRLRERHLFEIKKIRKIRVKTFAAAVRLGTAFPTTTEEAQYNLAWPVAAALLEGWVGPDQVAEERLADERIRCLAARVEVEHAPKLEQFFPNEALCEVEVELSDGTRLQSGVVGARGDPGDPLTETEMRAKFRALAGSVMRQGEIEQVEALVSELESQASLEPLLELLRSARPGASSTHVYATP